MGIDRLLTALRGLKRTGDGRWIARCPAHEDRSPSLAIRETSDGRILLHCFAGCETAAVIGAVGLEFADLFAEPLTREYLAPVHLPFSPLDTLRCLSREAGVIAVLASDLALGKQPDPRNLDLAQLAAGRIADALEVCIGSD